MQCLASDGRFGDEAGQISAQSVGDGAESVRLTDRQTDGGQSVVRLCVYTDCCVVSD